MSNTTDPTKIAPFLAPLGADTERSAALLMTVLSPLAETMREVDPRAGLALVLWRGDAPPLLIAGDETRAIAALAELVAAKLTERT